MNKNELDDVIFEALLRKAVIENHQRELSALPTKGELSELYTFSHRHEKRMNSLFAAERRKSAWAKIVYISKRAAAVFVIALTILSVALLTVPQVRATVWGTMVEWYNEFTKFSFSKEQTADENTEWRPKYLPKGFTESNAYSLITSKTVEYMNENGVLISLDYSISGNTSVTVDNEHSNYRSVNKHGVEYHVFEAETSEHTSKIIWENEGISFYIKSIITDDELLKVALSVSPKK